MLFVAPTSRVVMPSGQGVHDTAPALCLPLSQKVQRPMPGSDASWPGSHGSHAALPSFPTVERPAAQAWEGSLDS